MMMVFFFVQTTAITIHKEWESRARHARVKSLIEYIVCVFVCMCVCVCMCVFVWVGG